MKRPTTPTLIVASLVFATTVATALPGSAADGTPAPQQAASAATAADLSQALEHFTKARLGEGGHTDKAVSAFAALSRSDPAQPLYRAYLGSANTLMGRDAWAPWNKLRHTERGLEMVDEALAALTPAHDNQRIHGASASLQTRLVAASTFTAVPDGLFRRRAAARREVAAMLGSPALDAAPAGLQAAIHLAAANLARADGKTAEEQTQLRATTSFAGTPEAAEAQARLKAGQP